MENDPLKVFWSWQSDVFPKSCRELIRSALADAVSAVGGDLGLEAADRPELDHDTKGEPGMVDIAAVILRKIAASAVFVADLTPLSEAANGKALPNPNVLVELGWAFHKPGLERVIGVLNTASGSEIEDLPFDIRHRRILTYNLPEDADEKTRAREHKRLTNSLRGALLTNLSASLTVAAAAVEVVGVPSKEGEPSIWATAADQITHHDAFGAAGKSVVNLIGGPRAYIRVIAAGWKDRPPRVSDIARLPQERVVWPRGGGSSGDFGACEEGFVRYWINGHEGGRPTTSDVSVYFTETGEFWVISGTAIGTASGRTMLRTDYVFQEWSDVMAKALAILDQFAADPVRKVEVGLTGLSDVHWPSAWASDSPLARRPAFKHASQSRNWDQQEQDRFLLDTCNSLRDLFGLPEVGPEELDRMLGR